MADFTLTVKTDSSAELLDIVARIANSMPLPTGKSALEHGEAVHAEIERALSATKLPEHHNVGTKLPHDIPDVAFGEVDSLPAPSPDRDAHGIKRDDRIHANAADPFKANGTWKRKKNVPDEQYEEIHLELVREARAAGLYTGPAIPELELESRVGPFYWEFQDVDEFGKVDTLDELEALFERDRNCVEINEERYLKLLAEDSAVAVTVENNTDAELVVTQQPEAVTVTAVAPPAPAPAPVPAAPAAPGMSAESTPTYQQAVVALFNAGGPTAPQVALQAMGLTIATQATPQQLRDMVTAAEMVTALGIAPADTPSKGPEHTREALAALGYVAS
ncbi:hypothetical protein ACR2VJ_27470 [Klebsiella pneumoniae]